MTDVSQRIECKWCRGQSPADSSTCDRCGAPLDVRNLVSDSGWRETPRLRDLTEIAFSGGTVQVQGEVVPVVEVGLAQGAAVFFEHHAMLWKDDAVPMSVMNTTGGAKRMLGGIPFVISYAHGPGRIALSRESSGELVVLPLDPGTEVDARQHAMLVASANVGYSFEKIQGARTMFMVGSGMYLDRFAVQESTGVLVLHGYGNVLQRTLQPGERIDVEPGGFLYKDSSVTMTVEKQANAGGGSATQGLKQAKGVLGGGFKGLKAARGLLKGDIAGAAQDLRESVASLSQGASAGGTILLGFTGPGRVGIQSMSVEHEVS
jgi:uncharacterized protein (AIM24 family)